MKGYKIGIKVLFTTGGDIETLAFCSIRHRQ
jgi:hypothetical protein